MKTLTSIAAAFFAVTTLPVATAQNEATSDRKVYLEADTLTEDRQASQLIAEGRVVIQYEGRTLRANRLIYDLNSRKIRAQGNVQIIDPDGSVRFADEVEVDENLDDGVATEFTARLPNDSIVMARSAVRDAGGANSLENVVYTSCEICAESEGAPTWALRARRAVQNEQTQMISYNDAVLEIKGIPILYFPYLAHPDPTSDRRSGLLFPDFGASSTLGAFYQQPYLQVISPSQDVTIAPQVNSKVNPFVEVNYRKRFYSGEIELDGSLAYDYEFDSDGDRIYFDTRRGRRVSEFDPTNPDLVPSEESLRSHLFGRGLFELNETWDWGFGAERASDAEYTRRYDISGEGDQRGIYQGQPRQLVSQLFAIGQTSNFYADASLLSFQSLNSRLDNGVLPTVTPLIFADRYFDLGQAGMLSTKLSTAIVERSDADSSRRASASADWRTDRILPAGLVFEPFAEARVDYLDFSSFDTNDANQVVETTGTETRAAGHIGAELQYPFIRRGQAFDVVLEPTLMAAWGDSNVDNVGLPNEDSLLYELDDSSLFYRSGVSGYDRYETGGRVAAGLIATARFRSGAEVRGTFGRRWRAEEDAAFDRRSNLDGTASDYVLGASLDLSQYFTFNTSLRLDEDFQVNRVDAGTDFDFWRLKGRARYYRIDEDISIDPANPLADEGIDFQGEFQMTERWSATYTRLRDIVDGRDTKESIGLLYEDDCAFFSIEYQTREIGSTTFEDNESIQFRVGLRTLGSFGDREFD